MNIDVLNLEWNSSASRDREISTLICNYLRYMGFSVFEGQIHDGFRLIDKYRPKILYLAATTGASINFDVVKYAVSKEIHVVTGIVEGNFLEDDVSASVWGHNQDKILYEDFVCYWSDHTKDLAIKDYPYLEGKIKVCGYVGLDRYKFPHGAERNKYIASQEYNKVIGIGCWDFGVIKHPDSRYKLNLQRLSKGDFDFFLKDRDAFNNQLLELIANYKDILFLIKEHPGRQLGHWASAIEGCDKFDNVIIIHNELGIEECIRNCDLWISYDSTTSLEAWLLGKQTAVLNPNGIDFPMRCGTHHGQPVFSDAIALGSAIDDYYNHGHLTGFDDLKEERENQISYISKWCDGYNHVRFGNEIIHLLTNPPTDKKFSIAKEKVPGFLKRKYQWLLWYVFRLLRLIKPYMEFSSLSSNIRYQWDCKELYDLSNKRMRQQRALYEVNQHTAHDLRMLDEY